MTSVDERPANAPLSVRSRAVLLAGLAALTLLCGVVAGILVRRNAVAREDLALLQHPSPTPVDRSPKETQATVTLLVSQPATLKLANGPSSPISVAGRG